jgi:hypothetical protein
MDNVSSETGSSINANQKIFIASDLAKINGALTLGTLITGTTITVEAVLEQAECLCTLQAVACKGKYIASTWSLSSLSIFPAMLMPIKILQYCQ